MNEIELRKNFLEQKNRTAIALDGQKVQSFAALVITYDEMLGLIKSRQNLDILQKYELKQMLEKLVRNSVEVF